MSPNDKLEIVGNIREQGFDMTTKLIAPMVAQVEKYARQRQLQASEEENTDAVDRFVEVDKNRCVAVLKNGQQIDVSKQMYVNELPYNFLPGKYKTMIL